MTHEIVTQDFYGKPVETHSRDGALWFTSEQAATVLGLAGARSLTELVRDHKSELVEGVEFGYAKLAVATSGNQKLPQVRRVLCLSMQGVEFFALLVRGEAGKRARRWVVDLRASLRAKEKVIADPAALMARIDSMQKQLDEARAAHVFTLTKAMDNVQAITKDAFSAIASALAKRGALKKAEKKLLGEIKQGQKFLPGLGGSPVNRLPQN